MKEIGVAGWLFHRSILNDKTMTLLQLPAACKELGVGTVELVSTFFESQNARYLNDLRQTKSGEFPPASEIRR